MSKPTTLDEIKKLAAKLGGKYEGKLTSLRPHYYVFTFASIWEPGIDELMATFPNAINTIRRDCVHVPISDETPETPMRMKLAMEASARDFQEKLEKIFPRDSTG